MKNHLIALLATLLWSMTSTAQPIPADSLYLGQTPPGTTPVIFNLAIPAGSFDAERIAISNDGKEIYYTDLQAYYPTSGDTLRYYRYTANHWTGPFTLFPGYLAPALSVNDDTLFFQDNNTTYTTLFAVRTGNTWSQPHPIFTGLNTAHYYQATNSGNRYISTIPAPSLGAADWCTLAINGNDTTATTLGLPVSSAADNLDFFVARDEDFMILAKNGLKISYHKPDGHWTNPKSLGTQINFGLGAWGPFVTSDDAYLFYTTGTLPDYSDTHIYWVRVDALIDSLRYTNFLPYLLTKIPDQPAVKGVPFSYTLTDTTFIDDDGNHTLTYHATLLTGSPLPAWLSFDTISGTFTGTPPLVETLQIRVTATDTAGASVWTIMKIIVNAPVSTGKPTGCAPPVKLWPNPTQGPLHVSLNEPLHQPAGIEVFTAGGKVIARSSFTGSTLLDLSGAPRGRYQARLSCAGKVSSHTIILY